MNKDILTLKIEAAHRILKEIIEGEVRNEIDVVFYKKMAERCSRTDPRKKDFIQNSMNNQANAEERMITIKTTYKKIEQYERELKK